MKLLLIDTSTTKLSLAVSEGKKIQTSKNIKLKNRLSNSIIQEIDKILDKSNISLSRLDGFGIGLGPGSFTSLRVGLSTLKGFIFATNKPVVGISSLDILAQAIKGENANICSVFDARRGLIYACLYKNSALGLKRKSKYLLTNSQQLLERVNSSTIFIGDGINIITNEINESLKRKPNLKNKIDTFKFEDKRLWYPQAKFILPLIMGNFKSKKFGDINKLKPLYLYPEDCQVRR